MNDAEADREIVEAIRKRLDYYRVVMPEALVEPCVKAGCPEDGIVLDPFSGSGTVGAVAIRYGRQFIGIDLNPDYCRLAQARVKDELDKTRLLRA